MPKPFLNYDEQIYKLEHEKNLIINNRPFAYQQLRKIGYFSLISGYKDIFKIPITKEYIPGVTFEEIMVLYQFDENLRTLFFKYILHIEQNMKELLSYSFCKKHGESQKAYLNINHYEKSKRGVNRLLGVLHNIVYNNSSYIYINHMREVHGNIPLWVLTNILTFGIISKMYQFSTSSIQSKICKNFPYLNEKQLEQLLSVVTKFRNVCAHNERLFSYKTTDKIPDLKLHEKLSIPKINNTYIFGKKDLFAIVIAFRYLLPKDEFRQFKSDLSKLIHQLLKNSSHINQSLLFEQMGFPNNWETITRYRKI
ncbi:MAG: Abi family protein [Lachnospiraceae bacterium]|nr:Abi family protein [Lachnospiraceae bacterium]